MDDRTRRDPSENIEVDSGEIENLPDDSGFSVPVLAHDPDTAEVRTRERVVVQKRTGTEKQRVDSSARREYADVIESSEDDDEFTEYPSRDDSPGFTERPARGDVSSKEDGNRRSRPPAAVAAGDTDVPQAGGALEISEDAVAGIAALAAREVPGLAAHPIELPDDDVSTLPKNALQGVTAKVKNGAIELSLRVAAEYGVNLQEFGDQLRSTVQSRVEEKTGLPVRRLDINVAKIAVPDEESPPGVIRPDEE